MLAERVQEVESCHISWLPLLPSSMMVLFVVSRDTVRGFECITVYHCQEMVPSIFPDFSLSGLKPRQTKNPSELSDRELSGLT